LRLIGRGVPAGKFFFNLDFGNGSTSRILRGRAYPEILILAAPIILVLLTTFMVCRPRYTAAVEPELAVFAALGVLWLADRYRHLPKNL